MLLGIYCRAQCSAGEKCYSVLQAVGGFRLLCCTQSRTEQSRTAEQNTTEQNGTGERTKGMEGKEEKRQKKGEKGETSPNHHSKHETSRMKITFQYLKTQNFGFYHPIFNENLFLFSVL